MRRSPFHDFGAKKNISVRSYVTRLEMERVQFFSSPSFKCRAWMSQSLKKCPSSLFWARTICLIFESVAYLWARCSSTASQKARARSTSKQDEFGATVWPKLFNIGRGFHFESSRRSCWHFREFLIFSGSLFREGDELTSNKNGGQTHGDSSAAKPLGEDPHFSWPRGLLLHYLDNYLVK